ncbi:MAG: hypothetical protein JOZ69_14080, partial [Myxococcales bacterium]|nr:hypothetical protein [Myxococcales bacterium]
MRSAVAGWLAVPTALAACGGSLPVPEYVAQPSSALAPVDYPPPPALVEFVPERPGPGGAGGAVWVDGEWIWQGRRFAWRAGRWIVPPPGSAYSPWAIVRGEDGTVYMAPGAWRDAAGRELPEPAPLATARTNPGSVVNAEGEREDVGHRVRTLRPEPAPEPAPKPD